VLKQGAFSFSSIFVKSLFVLGIVAGIGASIKGVWDRLVLRREEKVADSAVSPRK